MTTKARWNFKVKKQEEEEAKTLEELYLAGEPLVIDGKKIHLSFDMFFNAGFKRYSADIQDQIRDLPMFMFFPKTNREKMKAQFPDKPILKRTLVYKEKAYSFFIADTLAIENEFVQRKLRSEQKRY